MTYEFDGELEAVGALIPLMFNDGREQAVITHSNQAVRSGTGVLMWNQRVGRRSHHSSQGTARGVPQRIAEGSADGSNRWAKYNVYD